MKAILPTLLAASALLVSCKEPAANTSDDNNTSGMNLDGIILTEAPAGAITITEARKNPTPGTEVVISGKVMGDKRPFVEDFALVTLGDPTRITSCDLRPGDTCETPWDVCCDEPDVITASIATVQVVGKDGLPVPKGLKGLAGMKELSSLVVQGVVAEGSNENNLLINATGIHVAMVEATTENPALSTQ